MTSQAQALSTFSASDIEAFRPALKIGLLATMNEQGLPHITLLSTLQANTPTQLIWGQFTEGRSKKAIRQNPKTAFLIMTLDKMLWRGKATFTHTARQGPEFDHYNNVPMFRYNAYFGVHTVYFMDLVEHTGREVLPMGKVVLAAVQTMLARALAGRRGVVETQDLASLQNPAAPLNLWTRQLLNKLDNLKFLAYVGDDGYPVIVPVIQAQAAGSQRVIFSLAAYGDALRVVPAGAVVALFGMSLEMEDVLLRGTYQGIQRVAGVPCGCLAVDWVYSPMPPVPQQIYPEQAIEPVTAF